jgi:hypothetical protein
MIIVKNNEASKKSGNEWIRYLGWKIRKNIMKCWLRLWI